MENDTMQEPKRRRKKMNVKLIAAAAVLFLGAVYIILSVGSGGSVSGGIINPSAKMGFAGADIEINYDYTANLSCFPTDTGFFFSTKDGIKYITLEGDIKMDYPFTMNAPELIGKGKYAAVAEGGGKAVYVFSDQGFLYAKNYELTESIISFSVNAQGYTSVILESGGSYRVKIYNDRGDSIPYEPVYQDANIFPVASDISDDGRILAISTLDINGIGINSHINFYYIRSDEAEDFSDGLFGSVTSFEDQIVAKIKFMDNNRLLSISDSKITGIATGYENYLQVLWHIELTNEVEYVAFPNNNAFAVALGEGFINKDSYPEGALLFYNMDGSLVNTYESGSSVTYLSGGFNGILAGSGSLGRTFKAFSDKGNELWEFTVTQDVRQMHFYGRTDKIILVSPVSLRVLERKRLSGSAGERFFESEDLYGEDTGYEVTPLPGLDLEEPGTVQDAETGSENNAKDNLESGGED